MPRPFAHEQPLSDRLLVAAIVIAIVGLAYWVAFGHDLRGVL